MNKVRVIAIALLMAMIVSVAVAQTETGQITGTVTDPSGAVVPNAKVTVRQIETGTTRTVNSSESGVYTVTNLLPGTYQITVESPEFAAQTKQVPLNVGNRVGADFQLPVGTAGTTVEVQETMPRLTP